MQTGIDRSLAGVAVAVLALTAIIGGLALTAPTAETDVVARPSGQAADPVAGVEAVHDAGVTGENVSVGVVDVTGFDPDHPALRGQVVATRAFAPQETVRNGGQHGHGTAAASLVTTVAPDADLHLATFDTADQYESAVEWLRSVDVDVVVAPVSFYGTPGDGSARVAQVTDRVAADDTVVVAPAGNLARGHWAGRYDDGTEGKLRFEGGTRNYLRGNDSRDLTVWLSWDRDRANEDYTAELYRTNGSTARLVAQSRPYEADHVPNERISVRLAGGTYFLVVRGPANATGTSLRLSSPTHALQYRTEEGSIVAPATAESVLAVGASDYASGAPEPFSSRGPTADGRRGVDVVAPDGFRAASRPDGFVGSSAAAPYVAGVAALVLDANPALDRDAVERVLEGSAIDVGEPGPDPAAGHGRVDAAAAVERARNETG